jgi:iron complex outermembrane receptor protein
VQWAANLNQGLISQTTANNCQAAGIPPNHSGVGVTAEAFAQGGLGVLEAETSTALVVGAILSPRFGFMPDTTINLAVDYFDIEVNGEISQLGAKNIIYGCYGSQNFPDDPLCDLFTRGQTAAPFNINQVFDKFINIASQRNSGFDVNFSVRHDMGALGRVNFTADATYQTRDKFQLLSTSPIESDNGEAGSPKWVADLRLSWTMPEDWTLFYGVNIIGPTSDQEDWTESNQSPTAPAGCIVSSIRGTYCPDLTASTVFYHNASITKEVGERFRFTIGLSNIFDRRPPRVSVLNAGEISMMGPVVAASQYPFVGRRAFVNVTSKF